MATEVKQPEQVIAKTTEEKVVEKTQQFWSRNSKLVTGVLAVAILLIAGFIVYKNYFKGPAELEANEAIWQAQQNFRIDSFRLALNGDGSRQNPGFLKVISKHSGTSAGNLAKFYAGASYLQLGDFNNAVKHLEDFSTNQVELKLRATGLLGDAYAEQGKNEKALEYYKKAATVFDKDEINSSEYLFRAGQLSDKMGKTKEAIEIFKELKQKFPNTLRANEVDKYLAKLGETSLN